MKKKIGLYFGSFNPIHVGHLIIANTIAQQQIVDEVWFVITPHNPHKEKHTLLSDHQRLQLVNLAIGENSKLKASDIEFKLPQPNYTINTLAHLTNKYPEYNFYLIIGGDNLQGLPKWHEYKRIIENYNILVYPRPNITIPKDLAKSISVLQNVPLIEISSTGIRDMLKQKKDVQYFIPKPALDYILEMHFYQK